MPISLFDRMRSGVLIESSIYKLPDGRYFARQRSNGRNRAHLHDTLEQARAYRDDKTVQPSAPKAPPLHTANVAPLVNPTRYKRLSATEQSVSPSTVYRLDLKDPISGQAAFKIGESFDVRSREREARLWGWVVTDVWWKRFDTKREARAAERKLIASQRRKGRKQYGNSSELFVR